MQSVGIFYFSFFVKLKKEKEEEEKKKKEKLHFTQASFLSSSAFFA